MVHRDHTTLPERRFHRTAAAAPRLPDDDRVRDGAPRFVLGAELGSGGMGRVMVATDTMLGRDVAIKQALADADSALFEREARITAQLEHPSIVPIHDAGRDEHGRPYYIMRRIAGEPLAERIVAAPDVVARLALVARFAVAVDAAGFAHARGIIHRDIKPWNILLGAHGETLLIDWGLARRLDEPHDDELDHHVIGTPGYMAPEQARGEPVDKRADVYALGATLLDILSGSVERGRSERWIERAAAGTLPPIEAPSPEIPAELVAIVGKALAHEPADRYRDAVELASDLHAFLDGRLVAAHRYTTVERTFRFVRQHRVAVAIAVIALGAVVAIGMLAIRRVVGERDLARTAERLAADRADVLLLDRASGLAERDPTRAAALLKTLPPGTQYAARARDIATIAAWHGIEHGAVAHRGSINALAIAPDGHSLLSAADDDTIQIRDLAAGTVRTVLRGVAVETAIWTDHGATITYAVHDGGIQIVAATGGEPRVLDPDAAIRVGAIWAPGDGDRVRILDERSHLVTELPTAGGAPRVLARDVAVVAASGELLVVAGAGAVRLVGADEHVIARYAGKDPATLAVASDGARVAASFPDTTREWDIASGKQLGDWPDIGPFVIFAGQRLFGPNRHRGGQLDLLIDSGSHQALAADWSVLWSTTAGSWVAVVDPNGDLGLLGDNEFRELRFDRRGARMVAGRSDSPYVAAGSTDGTIRWWDLRQLAAESYQVPNGMLCDVDADRIVMRLFGQIAIVPRAGAEPRLVESAGITCLDGHVGTRVVATDPSEPAFDVIDTTTGRSQHFAGQPLLGPHTILFTRDHVLYEIAGAAPVMRWAEPADVRGVVVIEGAIGAELADGSLVRIDASSRATTTFRPRGTPTLFVLGTDHTWWYAIGARIYHGDQMLGELPAPAQQLWLTANGECMVLAADQSVWHAVPLGIEQLSSVRGGPASSVGTRAIATVGFGDVRLAYLDTGERLVFHADATDVMIDDDARRLAIVHGGASMRVDVYTDPVPADPARLGAWLDAATNAVALPGNDAVTWRW